MSKIRHPGGYETWADFDRDNGVSASEANAGASIIDPDGIQPRLFFNRVTESTREKNRWHLDLAASAKRPDLDPQAAIDAEVTRAVGLGATVLRTSPHNDDLFTVLRDPEGNEFCLGRRQPTQGTPATLGSQQFSPVGAGGT